MPPPPEQPRISVIVPCWNAATTLDETLESIHRQSWSNWEGIVIDDGSTDDSATIARQWIARDSRFVLSQQRNAGLSAARNAGIRRARGPLLLFLDADDLIAPDKLAHHATAKGFADNTITYSDCRYFTGTPPYVFTRGKNGTDQPSLGGYSGSGLEILTWLAQGNIMPVSAPLVARELICRVGAFDPALNALEDWDLWIRCARVGARFVYDPSPAAETMIRLRPGSMSTEDARMLRNELRVRWKHHDLPIMRASFRPKRRFHLKAAVAELLKGHPRRAMGHALYAAPKFWFPRPPRTYGAPLADGRT